MKSHSPLVIKTAKCALFLATAFFVMLLSVIPVLELVLNPNVFLAAWLLWGLLCLMLLWRTLYHFTRWRCLQTVIAFGLWHLALFYAPPVYQAFQADSCYDEGGVWANGQCQTE